MVDAFFEKNKNRLGGIEYSFYINRSVISGEAFFVPLHWHYHAEILYFLQGKARLFIGRSFYEVSSGDLVFISPCEVHAVFIEKGEHVEYFIIGFDPGLLHPSPEITFQIKYVLPQISNIFPQQKAVIIRASNQIEISSLAHEMYREYQRKDLGFELAVTSGIYNVVLWLLRNLEQKGITLTPKIESLGNKIEVFKNTLSYIDEHCCENITASDIAKVSLMSYSHFAKLFKSIMHMPFTKYLNYLRIRKAEQLLQNLETNITQIALASGFSNTSYFIEQFKSKKGITPKQYRKMLFQGITPSQLAPADIFHISEPPYR